MLKEGLFYLSICSLFLVACHSSTPTNQSPSAQEVMEEAAPLSFLQFLQILSTDEDTLTENWQTIATHFLPDSVIHKDCQLRTQQIPFPPPFQLLLYEYLADQHAHNDMYLSIFDSSGQALDLLQLRQVSFDGNVTINVIDEKILEIEYYDFYRPSSHGLKDVYTENLTSGSPRKVPTSETIPGLLEYYDYENYLISSSGKLKRLSRADSVNLQRRYPFTSSRIISKDELNRYKPLQLRYMINEIYASHGYIFPDVENLHYFKRRKWYQAKHQRVDSLLTDIERLNIQTLSTELF